MLKIPLSPYKLSAELYSALFKTPKVEEEMTKWVGNIHSLAFNPDLYQGWGQGLETSYKPSMASRHLMWHSKILSRTFVISVTMTTFYKGICCKLHGAIQEPLSTLAWSTPSSTSMCPTRTYVL